MVEEAVFLLAEAQVGNAQPVADSSSKSGGQVLRLQDVQFGDGFARLAGAQKLDGQFEAQRLLTVAALRFGYLLS